MARLVKIWDYEEIRWSIDEIASPDKAEQADRLMELVKSKKPFDTGWNELKKEICSFRIFREKRKSGVNISVSCAMDDIDDLIFDVDEDGPFLTEDDLDAIWDDDEFCSRLNDIDTEISDTKTLATMPTLDEISGGLMEIWRDLEKRLEDGFAVVKSIVRDYKELKYGKPKKTKKTKKVS